MPEGEQPFPAMSLAIPSAISTILDVPAELKSGKIRLRPFTLDDVPELFAAVRESINELSAWMPWCHPGYSMEDSRKFILEREPEWRKDLHYAFAITGADRDELLGCAGLNFIERTRNLANLGYWIRSARTRQGVATSAVRRLARFGFEQLKFTRIEIVAALGNRASQRVAEKAGATREGVLRNGCCLRGTPQDAVIFSFIPQDLEPDQNL